MAFKNMGPPHMKTKATFTTNKMFKIIPFVSQNLLFQRSSIISMWLNSIYVFLFWLYPTYQLSSTELTSPPIHILLPLNPGHHNLLDFLLCALKINFQFPLLSPLLWLHLQFCVWRGFLGFGPAFLFLTYNFLFNFVWIIR